MLKKILLLLLLPSIIYAQNLVPNASFEEYDTCPRDQGQVYRVKYWNSFGNSPDYFNSCSQPLWGVSVPQNVWGFQYARTGNAYVGTASFYSSDTIPTYTGREFIGTKLITPLVVGQKYFVSFFVSLEEGMSNAACNKIGALFSTTSYAVDSFCPQPCSANNLILSNNAQIFTDSIIADTTTWIEISGSFIADSAYKYLIIGNFFSLSNVDFIPLDTIVNVWGAWYYIDDVYVGVDSFTGIHSIPLSEEIKLYPNPAIDKVIVETSHSNYLYPYKITLYDILGNELKIYIVASALQEINLSDLPLGTYLFKIINSNGIIINKKIVKI